jgi:hypothetical protein
VRVGVEQQTALGQQTQVHDALRCRQEVRLRAAGGDSAQQNGLNGRADTHAHAQKRQQRDDAT